MNADMTEHILERKGCPLHYWIGGPTSAPLVVLTHGLCVDHRSWDPIVPALLPEYRVMTWDVRGHGLSQPMGEPFRMDLAVEDLLAIVATQGVEQAFYVGHSNGTYIAQELAFRHPECVRALVIAGGTCITWKLSGFEAWITRVSPDIMRLFPFETLKRASLPYVSAKKEVQASTYQAYSMLSKEDYLTLMKGMTACIHYEPGYIIPHPMLLVHGEHDRMGNIVKIAPQWAKHEPHCEYVVIPNAGHFVILDQPAAFSRLLLEFLAKQAGC